MPFSDRFLDELRGALPVSAVVSRRHKLKKTGSEFRSLDDSSLTVNDEKGLWYDHGSGKEKGGDIFAWYVEKEGLTFPQAVEECAKQAGMSLPDDAPQTSKRNGSGNGVDHAGGPPDDGWEPPSEIDAARADTRDRQGGRQITRTYDYTDAQGSLIYQVCRIEWQEGGKRKKTFIQRRPVPGATDQWIWGLSAGEFLKGRDGNWYAATKERLEKWKGAERRRFNEGAEHTLYRLVELREEDPDRPVFIPEGEKDVETAHEWGLVSTTNSGGAKHWRHDFAEFFRGRHVVILADNDDAGRQGAEKRARDLHGVAASVKILDFGTVWKDAPKGADLTDWKELAGGTPEALCEIAAKLSQWVWTPPKARFQMIAFGAVRLARRVRYLVRGLIPRQGLVVVWGPPKCGKSFWVFDLLMHVALGWEYRGRMTEQGVVVYLSLEGQEGFSDRIEAFRQRHLADHTGHVPFYLIPTRLDLVKDHQQLIEDIRLQLGSVAPAAICIDTLNRSLRGSESNDQDMSAYVGAADAVKEAFGCAVIVVHHCGHDATRPRGHTSLTGAADAQIGVQRNAADQVVANVDYMKDGDGAGQVVSRLEGVEIGVDEYNFPVTSCVVVPVDAGEKKKGAVRLSAQERNFIDALIEALDEHGVAPTGSLANLPRSITKVVDYTHVKAAFAKKELNDGQDLKEHADRLRQALGRARRKLTGERVVATADPFIWLTGRPVDGISLRTTTDELPNDGWVPPSDIEDFQ